MANYTILLIDYEPRSIERFREPLAAAGYTIEIATDGVSGIEAFHRLNPDMVLVEAMIPKKHGFEVCQEIKRTPRGQRTPVLITTGVYKGRKYRTQALHIYGCDEYIEKPIAPEQLLKIVGGFLGSGASAPSPKATEPASVPPKTGNDSRAHATRGPSAKTAPSADQRAPESPRTRLTAVPQTVTEDDAEDEIIARLDAILPGGGNATQLINERETLAVVAEIESDPFAQMRAELDAELGCLSAALAFEPTLVPSDQVVAPSVLEALPVPEEEIRIAPLLPPTPVVADERPGQVVDFVAKRSRKNRKTERQNPERAPQAARIAPAPKPVELTLPPGTLVASELEPSTRRSGMPTWIWAGLGLVAVVAIYFVFARGGSSNDNGESLQALSPSQAPSQSQAPLQAPPTETEAIAPPVASREDIASAPPQTPSSIPEPLKHAPDSTKTAQKEATAPIPKKTPERVAKAPLASIPAPKPPLVPPAAPGIANSVPLGVEPKLEPAKEHPQEAPPSSALDENVTGVESVPEVATGVPKATTTIAPGTLIPIDEADTMPVARLHRAPFYSTLARQMRLSGTVVMNVLVNERGFVDQVVLVTGVPGADVNDTAIRAAESWTYRPATKNGVPVKVWKSEQIAFKL